MLTVGPSQARSGGEQLRCRFEVAEEQVQQRALATCFFGTRFECFRRTLAHRRLAARGSQPAKQPNQVGSFSPRVLDPRWKVVAAQLLCGECRWWLPRDPHQFPTFVFNTCTKFNTTFN